MIEGTGLRQKLPRPGNKGWMRVFSKKRLGMGGGKNGSSGKWEKRGGIKELSKKPQKIAKKGTGSQGAWGLALETVKEEAVWPRSRALRKREEIIEDGFEK